MKLLVGLGNAGEQYAHTRHNIGFRAAEAVAAQLGATFADQPKLSTQLANVTLAAGKLLIAKPTTMMNASGTAVQAIMTYYKIAPADVAVVYDDVDVPLGTVRYRRSQTASGQLGIQSVLRTLGGNSLYQIRVGISDNRAVQLPSEAYVLQPFNPDEAAMVELMLPRLAADIVQKLATMPDATTTFTDH